MKNTHPTHNLHACKPGAHLPLHPGSAPHITTRPHSPLLTHPPHVPLPCSFSKGQWVSSMDQPFCSLPHPPKVLFCLFNVRFYILAFYIPVLSDDHVKIKTRQALLQRGHGGGALVSSGQVSIREGLLNRGMTELGLRIKRSWPGGRRCCLF